MDNIGNSSRRPFMSSRSYPASDVSRGILVNIMKVPLLRGDISLEEMDAEIRRSHVRDGLQIVEASDVVVNGYRAKKLITISANGAMKFCQIYSVRNGEGVRFDYMAPAERYYDRYLSTALGILRRSVIF